MIFKGTILFCVDNTNIKKIKCINFMKTSRLRFGKSGCIIKSVIFQRDLKKSKHVKGVLQWHLIITIVKKLRRLNGNFICFDYNRCLTMSLELKFLGTRVYGPISKEIRSKNLYLNLYKRIIIFAVSTV